MSLAFLHFGCDCRFNKKTSSVRRDFNTSDMSFCSLHYAVCTFFFFGFGSRHGVVCVFNKVDMKRIRIQIYYLWNFLVSSLSTSLPLPKKFLVTRYLNIINALLSFCVFYIDFSFYIFQLPGQFLSAASKIYVLCDFNLWKSRGKFYFDDG